MDGRFFGGITLILEFVFTICYLLLDDLVLNVLFLREVDFSVCSVDFLFVLGYVVPVL